MLRDADVSLHRDSPLVRARPFVRPIGRRHDPARSAEKHCDITCNSRTCYQRISYHTQKTHASTRSSADVANARMRPQGRWSRPPTSLSATDRVLRTHAMISQPVGFSRPPSTHRSSAISSTDADGTREKSPRRRQRRAQSSPVEQHLHPIPCGT